MILNASSNFFPLSLMCGKSPWCCIAHLLVIVGALNWGLVGAFNFNLVEAILGAWPMVVKIVYILVGLSGLCGVAAIAKHGGKCGSCGSGSGIPS